MTALPTLEDDIRARQAWMRAAAPDVRTLGDDIRDRQATLAAAPEPRSLARDLYERAQRDREMRSTAARVRTGVGPRFEGLIRQLPREERSQVYGAIDRMHRFHARPFETRPATGAVTGKPWQAWTPDERSAEYLADALGEMPVAGQERLGRLVGLYGQLAFSHGAQELREPWFQDPKNQPVTHEAPDEVWRNDKLYQAWLRSPELRTWFLPSNRKAWEGVKEVGPIRNQWGKYEPSLKAQLLASDVGKVLAGYRQRREEREHETWGQKIKGWIKPSAKAAPQYQALAYLWGSTVTAGLREKIKELKQSPYVLDRLVAESLEPGHAFLEKAIIPPMVVGAREFADTLLAGLPSLAYQVATDEPLFPAMTPHQQDMARTGRYAAYLMPLPKVAHGGAVAPFRMGAELTRAGGRKALEMAGRGITRIAPKVGLALARWADRVTANQITNRALGAISGMFAIKGGELLQGAIGPLSQGEMLAIRDGKDPLVFMAERAYEAAKIHPEILPIAALFGAIRGIKPTARGQQLRAMRQAYREVTGKGLPMREAERACRHIDDIRHGFIAEAERVQFLQELGLRADARPEQAHAAWRKAAAELKARVNAGDEAAAVTLSRLNAMKARADVLNDPVGARVYQYARDAGKSPASAEAQARAAVDKSRAQALAEAVPKLEGRVEAPRVAEPAEAPVRPQARPTAPKPTGLQVKPQAQVVADLEQRAQKPIDSTLDVRGLEKQPKKLLTEFVKLTPEFVIDPVLTVGQQEGETRLIFGDGYRFAFDPENLGLDATALTAGQRIAVPLADLGFSQANIATLRGKAETGVPIVQAKPSVGRIAARPAPSIPKPLKPKERAGKGLMKVLAPMQARRVPADDAMGNFGVTADTLAVTDGDRLFIVNRPGIAKELGVEVPAGESVTVTATGAKVDSTFPDYRHVMPEQSDATLAGEIDLAASWRNLHKAMGHADPESPFVAMYLNPDGTMGFEARTPEKATAEINKQGDSLLLGIVDPKHLLDSIQAHMKLGSTKVDLHWQAADRPFITTGSKGDTGLIMPGEHEDYPGVDAEQLENWRVKVGLAAKPVPAKTDAEIAREAKRIVEGKPARVGEEPSVFTPTKDVANVRQIVVDEFRDWPADVPKPGEDFWIEVMAGARELMTPYRYKALRQTLLGVFRYGEGIQAQDITDNLTTIHELGHDIDWLLNDKSFPRSIVLRFPGAEGEMALRAELKKVSELLRPDLWAARSKRSYVRRHTELMADFLSLYVLDPEQTARLAPKMAALMDKRLGSSPEVKAVVDHLREVRFEGPERPPVAAHIREQFPVRGELEPFQLTRDLTSADYVAEAKELGIKSARQFKALMVRARAEAERIRGLVPIQERRQDLRVLVDGGTENLATGKPSEQIEAQLTARERKAVNLYRAYQERARQTVNKYLRGADIAEYIKFLEDYFIHVYQRPASKQFRSAIARWSKRSPNAQKRKLPTLEEAVEMGLVPRTHDIADGLELWAGINYRVATNIALLRALPKLVNESGESIMQNPKKAPEWPTVDYWPIRQTYAKPLKGHGVLLWQGRTAVDPKVKPFIVALFDKPFTHPVARAIAGVNAAMKAMELTVFSFFHHWAETHSAIAAMGAKTTGLWGKEAEAFGARKLFGIVPARIGVLKAGKQLEQTPAFMEDYILHGGQVGFISSEGINLIDRSLRSLSNWFAGMAGRPGAARKLLWLPWVPTRTTSATYSWFQHLLWDNVLRVKLVTYYRMVADGMENSKLPIKEVKEVATKYVADNFGGQEWLNTIFKHPKWRWGLFQLFLSLDWTWSQIKMFTWPLRYGKWWNPNPRVRKMMRARGRSHWFNYLFYGFAFTQLANYATVGKPTWENEYGARWDIDWTGIWRSLPWNRDWRQRRDTARRYIGLGKAGREIARWFRKPLRAFGSKMAPAAKTVIEQLTGSDVGGDWDEPWKREDLEGYEEMYERFKHVAGKFKPFALSGNNAFMAFPSHKGMTWWKAVRCYEDIYVAKAEIAAGGIRRPLAKLTHALDRDTERLRREIAEAAILNGVDPDDAERKAIAGVRKRYYRKFWNAARKLNVKGCDRWAPVLLTLGATGRGAPQSLLARGLTPESERMAWRAMQKQGFEDLGTYEQMLDRRAYNLGVPKADVDRDKKAVKFLVDRGVTREQAIEGVRRHYLESLRKRGARSISTKTLAGRLSRLRRRWDKHASAAAESE